MSSLGSAEFASLVIGYLETLDKIISQNILFYKGQTNVLIELSAEKLNLARNIQLLLRNQVLINKFFQAPKARESFTKVFQGLKEYCLNSKKFSSFGEKGQSLVVEFFSALFSFVKFNSLYCIAEKSLASESIEAGEFFRAMFLEFLVFFSHAEG